MASTLRGTANTLHNNSILSMTSLTPYNNNNQQFQTQQDYNAYNQQQGRYDYHDNPYGGGYTDDPTGQPVSKEQQSERSVFEHDDFSAPRPRGPKTSKALRRWRYEHQGNIWTKGGRGRCFGRFFCCTIMIFVFLLVSIILSLALWIRPPDIEIGGITQATSGSTFQLQSDGVSFNGGINITVNNPNYFSVKFETITADVIYPLNNTRFGGGTLKDLEIKSNQLTEFNFPLPLTTPTPSIPTVPSLMISLLSVLPTRPPICSSSTRSRWISKSSSYLSSRQ
ncbi:hypothetical protein QCA50_003111 [Cerrena zonata]|uniref:Late embryogenesis abundant protein LEA-2 subgroup domain-containing protein n=1 Tax=Cerrena zonata TaxID=2478898 RepID=A0AAW0GNT9_9APHY